MSLIKTDKPKTVIVWTCGHATPEVNNERFSWLGSLIYDIKPDYCVDLGDGSDMKSLNSYDTRNPAALVTQSYEKDIDSYLDSQERLRHKFRYHKRKKPAWYGFEGNHENRIKKAIAHDPRIEGEKRGVSFSHLNTKEWFNEYHEYTNSAPYIACYDGIYYAHFIGAGAYGRPISGEHHGSGLIKKLGASATVGHSHKLNHFVKAESFPNPTNGLVAGCFKGADEGWAGQANREWSKGVCIKRNLANGHYDLQFISMAALKKEYS